MRTALFDLVQVLRLRIGDPPTLHGTQVLTDDELQMVLDGQRMTVRYLELEPLPTIALTGVTYLEYCAPLQYADRMWESDATVVDGTYTSLTPASADYLNGRWLFSANQDPPVLLSGNCYDLAAAAADALERWAAKEKLSFDFSADGASYQRSQKVKVLLELAREWRRQVKPRSAQLRV